MIEIQTSMANRALELLMLPDRPCLILDIGCGTGLSGDVLGRAGHQWVGMDISQAMLEIAVEDTEGHLVLSDMGQGVPFRPGVFDACISISALQWLCNADKSSHNPVARLRRFFQTLYACLSGNARAVFQFYPENPAQLNLISSTALRCGFNGGVLVDFPHSSKARKYFLVIYTGKPPAHAPVALTDESVASSYNQAKFMSQRGPKPAAKESKSGDKRSRRTPLKNKKWVLDIKERQRRQGKTVRPDSKFTARSRRRFAQ